MPFGMLRGLNLGGPPVAGQLNDPFGAAFADQQPQRGSAVPTITPQVKQLKQANVTRDAGKRPDFKISKGERAGNSLTSIGAILSGLGGRFNDSLTRTLQGQSAQQQASLTRRRAHHQRQADAAKAAAQRKAERAADRGQQKSERLGREEHSTRAATTRFERAVGENKRQGGEKIIADALAEKNRRAGRERGIEANAASQGRSQSFRAEEAELDREFKEEAATTKENRKNNPKRLQEERDFQRELIRLRAGVEGGQGGDLRGEAVNDALGALGMAGGNQHINFGGTRQVQNSRRGLAGSEASPRFQRGRLGSGPLGG